MEVPDQRAGLLVGLSVGQLVGLSVGQLVDLSADRDMVLQEDQLADEVRWEGLPGKGLEQTCCVTKMFGSLGHGPCSFFLKKNSEPWSLKNKCRYSQKHQLVS